MGSIEMTYMEIANSEITAVEVRVKNEKGKEVAVFRNYDTESEVWKNQKEVFSCRDIAVILEMYRQKNSGYEEER